MSENDFLKQLEEEFGIRSPGTEPEIHVINSRKHAWSLRKMTFTDLEIANNLIFGDKSSDVEVDLNIPNPFAIGLRTQLAFVSTFLAAIDGKPCWEIFKITKTKDKVTAPVTLEDLAGHHPLDPPLDIRVKTAKAVYEFMKSSNKLGLITELFEEYTNNIDEDIAERLKAPPAEGANGDASIEKVATEDPTDRPTQRPLGKA